MYVASDVCAAGGCCITKRVGVHVSSYFYEIQRALAHDQSKDDYTLIRVHNNKSRMSIFDGAAI